MLQTGCSFVFCEMWFLFNLLGEVLTWILGWPQKVPYPWQCTVKATPRTAWERQEVVQKKSPLLRPPDFPPGSHFGLPSRRLILPLHSGRGLGGSTWYKSVKTSVIPKNYSLFRTSESNRVSFLCLDQRCGLTAAKAQSLSLSQAGEPQRGILDLWRRKFSGEGGPCGRAADGKNLLGGPVAPERGGRADREHGLACEVSLD